MPEPAHDAEIDGDDAAFGVDEQISRMHVGVEEAVAHGVAKEGLHQTRPERLHIVTCGGEPVAIRDRDAVDPFERQHPSRASRPIDPRHAEAFVVLRVLGHLGDGGGLHAEIHLDGDGLGQRVDHGNRPQPARGRMEALDHARGEEIAVEVPLEALLDAGPQHLDGDRLQLAVGPAQLRLVHLGDRGGGDRRPELGVELVDRRAERLLDRRPASACEKGGRRSWRVDKSRASSRPMMSSRVARNWPSLMYDGPSEVSAVGELGLVAALAAFRSCGAAR